ncbi:MAG: ATP-binding cassette domain-containing protein [Aigarchaeota archaeon]|nr:ATP-binding cassette domain-containing protein [Candidatus Caldarchaeales archaeon]
MALLLAENLSKKFDRLTVLNEINLQIGEGDVLGVIGPNGAGKTTLINVLTGVIPVDKGRVLFRKIDITNMKAFERFRLGIGRTFQDVRPFLSLSVKENVAVASKMLGAEPSAVSETLQFFALEKLADTKLSECNLFIRKKVELAKAIVGKTYLVFLDEPFAGLAEQEIYELIDIIKNLNKNGLTFVVVEHVVTALVKLAKKILVIHLGAKLAEGSPSEIVSNQDVLKVYLGEQIEFAGS